VLTLLLIGTAALLLGVALDGPLGRWDAGIVRDLAAARTPTLDRWTLIGSYLGDTVTVIAVATLATVVLAIKRAWALAAFLVGALLVEVTSFLVTALVIDRSRPPVAKLDMAPPTSSFPSGHTAASIVLYVGLAIVVTSLTTNRLARAAAWLAAILLPAAVAVSRLARGMHYPTDLVGSALGAFVCLVVSLVAVRAALASADVPPSRSTS
jgi:membrane-associated phospholipid phosphatase